MAESRVRDGNYSYWHLLSAMSFFKGFIDSLGSIFTDSTSDSIQQYPSNPPITQFSFDGACRRRRLASHECESYLQAQRLLRFSQQEIAKAVRVEEWGLVDDAIVTNKNAQRILLEGSSTTVPSYVSSRIHFTQHEPEVLPKTFLHVSIHHTAVSHQIRSNVFMLHMDDAEVDIPEHRHPRKRQRPNVKSIDVGSEPGFDHALELSLKALHLEIRSVG